MKVNIRPRDYILIYYTITIKYFII